MPRLKPYALDLATRRGRFSVGFTAMDDGAALAQVARWLDGSEIAAGDIVRIVGPDGREVPRTQAPLPERTIDGCGTFATASGPAEA